MVQDTGKRRKFESGAVRDPGLGKGRFDLIPPHPLMRLAKHYEAGAKKYSERNWEKGIPLWCFLDSAFRHLVRFIAGDRSEDHLAAVLWNIAGYMQTEHWICRGKLPSSLRTVEIADHFAIGLDDENKDKAKAVGTKRDRDREIRSTGRSGSRKSGKKRRVYNHVF